MSLGHIAAFVLICLCIMSHTAGTRDRALQIRAPTHIDTHTLTLFIRGPTHERTCSEMSFLMAELSFEMCYWFQFEKLKCHVTGLAVSVVDWFKTSCRSK